LVWLPSIPYTQAAIANSNKQPSLVVGGLPCEPAATKTTQTVLPDPVIPATMQLSGCTKRNWWRLNLLSSLSLLYVFALVGSVFLLSKITTFLNLILELHLQET